MNNYDIRKSILTSTVFWSVVLLLCQAVGPSVERAIERGTVTPADAWATFQACVTALVGVMARYSKGDLYTPRGIPGADPPSRVPDRMRITPEVLRSADDHERS
jgi:hypothetical protein